MEVIKQISEFFNSSFVSTISGVIIGGYITIKINTLSERKRILMELKINIWNKLSEYFNKISNLIIKMEEDLEKFKYGTISYSQLVSHLDVALSQVQKIIENIQDELNKNTLIILSEKEFTKTFVDKTIDLISELSTEYCEVSSNSLKIEKYFKVWEDSFINLYGELQSYLLKGLYSSKKVKKIYEKKLNK